MTPLGGGRCLPTIGLVPLAPLFLGDGGGRERFAWVGAGSGAGGKVAAKRARIKWRRKHLRRVTGLPIRCAIHSGATRPAFIDGFAASAVRYRN